MSTAQTNEFKSRVNFIESKPHKLKRSLQRDQFGAIIVPKSVKIRFGWLSALHSLVLLYAIFTIFKAVFIYNADQSNYTQILSDLRGGNNKEQVVAALMSPDYFTKPVGVLVAGISDHMRAARKQ